MRAIPLALLTLLLLALAGCEALSGGSGADDAARARKVEQCVKLADAGCDEAAAKACESRSGSARETCLKTAKEACMAAARNRCEG